MACQRPLASILGISKLSSPVSARTSTAFLRPARRVPRPPPSAMIRLAHSIPRPSPFTQPEHQPTSTATTPPSSSSTPSTTPTSTAPGSPTPSSPTTPNILQQPHYELTFTCRPCSTRSRHRISKQGYHHGTVLVACPECKNKHVISDHLRIFSDASEARTVEEILREKGETIRKGTVVVGGQEGEGEGGSGDMEFWEDGSSNPRQPWEDQAGVRIGGWGKKEGDAEVDENAAPGSTFKSVKPGDR
ncbi:DNL zinc finger-domain-containing protein [Dichotomopilus funicola]|uniref:DNL zinc finger-domain-containing protein n=1 Tax=Dichotomopilus funicola TaxID=1934379 RepID=A0AAN6ZMM1_9PEZI|nr:DNL zinc finger-domain-containing protein [Dichotomopilus funicola]